MPFSGPQYGLSVYEGYFPAAPAATGGAGPSSNVQDINENGGRLGCGEPTVFITYRCSNGVLCVLENVGSLHYERRLDDISEADVTIPLGGDANSTCCECLDSVEPWCHELHIWRDGEEVWVGPITEINYSYDEVNIKAKDPLGFLLKRIQIANFTYVGPPTDVVTIGEAVIQAAFSEDTVTCEVDNIYTQLSGSLVNIFLERYTGTYYDALTRLGDIGLDFTTLGRTIVLVGDEVPFIPLVILNDEHIMGGVVITKDGMLQENRAFVHYDGDLGVPAVSTPDPDFFCYGPIEELHSGDGLVELTSSQQVANAFVNAASIAPRFINLPPGSQLSPDTPWTFDKMVCGARVDVAITKTCFQLTQSFRLSAIDVDYDAANGERIGITLSPVTVPVF